MFGLGFFQEGLGYFSGGFVLWVPGMPGSLGSGYVLAVRPTSRKSTPPLTGLRPECKRLKINIAHAVGGVIDLTADIAPAVGGVIESIDTSTCLPTFFVPPSKTRPRFCHIFLYPLSPTVCLVRQSSESRVRNLPVLVRHKYFK